MVTVTREHSVLPGPEPRRWRFFDYVDEDGVNQIATGIDALPASTRHVIRARLDARVQVFQVLRELSDWRGAEPLTNPRDGVIEISLDPERGHFAALAAPGPAGGDVTLLSLVRRRRGRVSRPDRQTARDRVRAVSAGSSRVCTHVVG
jgi:hypothetical protein